MGWGESPQGSAQILSQVSSWEDTELWSLFPPSVRVSQLEKADGGMGGLELHPWGWDHPLPPALPLGFGALSLLPVPNSPRAWVLFSGKFVCLFSCLLCCFCSGENSFSVPEASLPPCTLSLKEEKKST